MATAKFFTRVKKLEDASHFTWEYPVPDNDFWRSFHYPAARNFLQCFTREEIDKMQLNERHGADGKIGSEEVDGKPLYETDPKAWEKAMMAIVAIYGETGQLAEQIRTAEMMVERCADKANLSHVHSLTALLTRRGKAGDFERAEQLERTFTPWVDGKLGRNSLQSLFSRRIIAKAVWMQGRQEEATCLIEEIFALIREMRHGSFAVYQDSEKKMTDELAGELKKKRPMSS